MLFVESWPNRLTSSLSSMDEFLNDFRNINISNILKNLLFTDIIERLFTYNPANENVYWFNKISTARMVDIFRKI